MTDRIVIDVSAAHLEDAIGIARDHAKLNRECGQKIGAWIAVCSTRGGKLKPFHVSRLKGGGIKIRELCDE